MKKLFIRSTFFGDNDERYNAGNVVTFDDEKDPAKAKYAERIISAGFAVEIDKPEDLDKARTEFTAGLAQNPLQGSSAPGYLQPAPVLTPEQQAEADKAAKPHPAPVHGSMRTDDLK